MSSPSYLGLKPAPTWMVLAGSSALTRTALVSSVTIEVVL
jgi:hypothetical protein